jgi:hypothetical protein
MTATRRYVPGDRVFAPWEREWLYPGTVTEVDDDDEVAGVEFDDGDFGPAPVLALRPIALDPGAFVAARRDRDVKRYAPATVLAVSGETVRVEYEDGETDTLEVEFLRVPVVGHLAVGARVFAPWEREWLYPGTVAGLVGMVVDVTFDDGDHTQVLVPELRPLALSPGQLVGARREREVKRYLRAAVVRVTGETALVEYDDGETDDLPVAMVRLPAYEA